MVQKRAGRREEAAREKAPRVVAQGPQEVLEQLTSPLQSARPPSFSLSFLGQSSRSNYCGVYATGMLLSLVGVPTSRARVIDLFNLKRCNPDFEGATHEAIGSVFAQAADAASWRWQRERQFEFRRIHHLLKAQLQCGAPTLLSFGAIHSNGVWRCVHAVVVVGLSCNSIEVLDPLGFAPCPGKEGNASLLQPADPAGRVQVVGNSYRVEREQQASVLEWSR